METRAFSPELQAKINELKTLREPTKLGSIQFDSKLILAPMAGICTPPFRLLMEDLGAGGTVSELISATGILFENKRTHEMLKVDEREKNIGIQLFGEDAESLGKACVVAARQNPKFLDLNMGCPVRKVVQKGGGSALMKEIESLAPVFRAMKEAVDIPVSIKIRMGWDADGINADKIEYIAREEGIEWVAIHGRTRAQQYTGLANWDYIEEVSQNSKLPIIGNGDLHQPFQVQERLEKTTCDGLMIARGCLRNPFIFLESLPKERMTKSLFKGKDYLEIINRLYDYTVQTYDSERTRLVQIRKLIVWFAAGFPNAARFRDQMFKSRELDDTMKIAEDYFLSLQDRDKNINYNEVFMNSGHG
tara:strand:+ start:23397 stop:24482 length:1086 start_codon:yes stop_codon:yes gene_type:complete